MPSGGVSFAGGTIPDLGQQPLMPFFELEFGGLKNIYQDPEIPMSMTFIQEVSSNLNKLDVRLLDASGADVEPEILNSLNDLGFFEGHFQFGYMQPRGIKSPRWTFQLDYYTPQFEPPNGFTIQLEGLTNMGMAVSNNKVSGTVEEVIKKMADIHFDGKYQITQPLSTDFMLETGYLDQDTTELREMKHTKMMTESDWNYVSRILMFARDQNGIGGYTASEQMINGQRTLLIQRPLDPNQIEWTYDDQAKECVIKRWQPSIKVGSALVEGLNNHHINSIQPISGNTQKLVHDQQIIKDFQVYDVPPSDNPPTSTPKQDPADKLLYTCSETCPDNVTKNSVRSRVGYGSISPHAGSNVPLYDTLDAWNFCHEGQLILLGDPTIYPGVNIDLKIHYPQNLKNKKFAGKLHYTSGVWYIDRVTHTIMPGSYLSVLDVRKSTLNLKM